MTFNEIKTSLEAHGYRFTPDRADMIVGRFFRAVNTERRDAGSQQVFFEVVLYDRATYVRAEKELENRYSLAVNLRFEAISGVWVSMSAYSVEPADFLADRAKYENLLKHYFESL